MEKTQQLATRSKLPRQMHEVRHQLRIDISKQVTEQPRAFHELAVLQLSPATNSAPSIDGSASSASAGAVYHSKQSKEWTL
jgi:hypothetical protein